MITSNYESDFDEIIIEFTKKVFLSNYTLKYEFFRLTWESRAFSFVQMTKTKGYNLKSHTQTLFRTVLKKTC